MRLILSVVCALNVLLLASQNLVKNGSFEEYYRCHEDPIKNRFPVKHWDRIHTGNTSDYTNPLYDGCGRKNDIWPGSHKNSPYEVAHTGDGYIGGYPISLNFKTLTQIGYNEPFHGALLDTLEKDSTYKVSIAINLPKTSTYNPRSYSIVFMQDSLINPSFHEGYDYLKLWKVLKEKQINIVEFDITSIIYKRKEWVTFTQKYKAKGNEKYLLVGFYPRFTERQAERYEKLAEKSDKRFYKALVKCYSLHKEKADAPEGDFENSYFYVDDVKVELKK